MIDFEDIVTALGNGILPNAIQFVWVLLAFVGITTIGFAMLSLYKIASDGPEPGGATEGAAFVRLLLGGLMVVPSVTLWHAANLFLDGGNSTAGDLLTYITSGATVTGCDNFARAIQLGFMFVGVVAIYRAFRAADDAAKGFNREGYRQAIVFFIGGLGCFFIDDLMDVVGNEIGFDIGFDYLCTALGT